MDDRRFDMLARELGRRNRRGFLKAMLGIGGVAVSGTLVVTDAAAARRGFSGPTFPTPPPPPPPPSCTSASPNWCSDSETCCSEGEFCSPYGCCTIRRHPVSSLKVHAAD